MLIEHGMDFRNWLLATTVFRSPIILAQIAYTDNEIGKILAEQERRQGLIERYVK